MKKQTGFTLIEVIVYITLSIMLVTVFTGFTANVIKASAKIYSSKEVASNYRFISSRIKQELKTSSALNYVHADRVGFDDQNGVGREFFYDSAGQAVVFNNGSTQENLNSGEVKVISLVFSSQGPAISAAIELEYINDKAPGDSPYRSGGDFVVVPRLNNVYK